MGHKFADIMFTPTVQKLQSQYGSRESFSQWDHADDFNGLVDVNVEAFLAERDSFYMASVTETGWPYVQHRGGPKGFMRVLNENTIGFADFSGNRQYVSTGNFKHNDRVSLFFMDYPNKRRLKMLGRVEIISLDQHEQLAQLEMDSYRANVERGFLIHVEAFDWNCPQHITPRFDQSQIEAIIAPLIAENTVLKSNQMKLNSVNISGNVSGNGSLPLAITGVRQLTPRIRAYELRHHTGEDLPVIDAGANLVIPVPLDNGEVIQRNYSICSNPARRDIYEIAVLRDDNGRGGSQAVHKYFELGLQLNIQPPENYFPLHTDNRPALLLAAGIGITPIKAMAQQLQAQGNDLSIHYTGRSLQEMAFTDRLEREFKNKINIYSKADSQRLSIKNTLRQLPQNGVVYACGPNAFIDDVRRTAEELNIPSDQIRFERFSPPKNENEQPVTLHLTRSDQVIQVAADQTLLEGLLDAGINTPSSCLTGECRTCAVNVVEGDVDHRDNVLTDTERHDKKLMCPCVSRATSKHLTLDL